MLSVVIGVVAGVGAVLFRGLIALVHNLFFLGKFSVTYNANVHTPPSPWGPFVILVPVLGALLVAFLIQNFAREAKGHGVPEVIDAIYYGKGNIRPVVALVKSLASALSIGSGGAVGREGPIIQIGSSFGSTVGQMLEMPTWQRITLIAAGAGGGIAATFNTPIGGILFAIEIVMHELSVRTLVPVAISTAVATYIGRVFFGDHPSFDVPSFETYYFHLTGPLVLVSYIGLGVLLGLAATLFIKSIYWFEDRFETWIRRSYYLRHMCGMLLVGVMMYLLMRTLGHYYIEGIGYSTIQDILTGNLLSIKLLALLFVLKLTATSLTLGSGASGGVFSPGLYLGATLGAAYGALLKVLVPGLSANPADFAVAGMAGMIGGSTGAAVTAIVMIFEMTLDYNVILPVTLTVAIAYLTRRMLCRDTIYTLKLRRREHYVPDGMQASHYQLRPAREFMDANIKVVPSSRTLGEFINAIPEGSEGSYFLVEEDDHIEGVITKHDAHVALRFRGEGCPIGEVASREYVVVGHDASFVEAIDKLRRRQASYILIVGDITNPSADNENVKGIIGRELIGDAMIDAMHLFLE
jgi:CIC family chloride channel protein